MELDIYMASGVPANRSLQIVVTSGQSLSVGTSSIPRLISSGSRFGEQVLALDFGNPRTLASGLKSVAVNVSEFRGFIALEERDTETHVSGMMDALKSSYDSAGMESPALLHINTGAGSKSILQLMTSSKDVYASLSAALESKEDGDFFVVKLSNDTFDFFQKVDGFGVFQRNLDGPLVYYDNLEAQLRLAVLEAQNEGYELASSVVFNWIQGQSDTTPIYDQMLETLIARVQSSVKDIAGANTSLAAFVSQTRSGGSQTVPIDQLDVINRNDNVAFGSTEYAFQAEHPAEVAVDYTHLNSEGYFLLGQTIGRNIFDFLQQKENKPILIDSIRQTGEKSIVVSFSGVDNYLVEDLSTYASENLLSAPAHFGFQAYNGEFLPSANNIVSSTIISATEIQLVFQSSFSSGFQLFLGRSEQNYLNKSGTSLIFSAGTTLRDSGSIESLSSTNDVLLRDPNLYEFVPIQFGVFRPDSIIGSADDISFVGGENDDILFGNSGNDRLDGGLGADNLNGGAGNDTYVLDNVGDVVNEYDGAGDDAGGIDIVTSSVSFALTGTAVFVENLTLVGIGARNATGNARNNVLNGNAAANTLSGDSGNDSLHGNAGDDTLFGGLGDDLLFGGDGVDNLFGNDGIDCLDGGLGADVLKGGAGNDTYVVDNAGDVVDEYDGAGGDAGGIDIVTSSVSFALTGTAAFVENLALNGTAAVNATGNARNNVLHGNAAANTLNGDAGNDNLNGNAGDDTLFGGLGDDSLVGGDGADNLFGNDGNDRLVGGTGADIMNGGAGNDTYDVENIGDVVDETNGAGGDAGGIDIVNSSVSFVLASAAFVENLTLTGIGATNATGNAGNNVLTGNAAANTLNGDAGNDSLSGNAGDDTLIGGLGDDSLAGGDGVDNLFGNDGNDRLSGGIGADTLNGSAGNDTYDVDNIGDVVDETNGAGGDAGGTDIVNSTVSFALTGTAAFVENLTLIGTATVDATGNARNNVLTGNAAANTLNGDAGNDSLSGNAGDDTLIGGLGDDSLAGGDGVDNLFGNDGNDRLDGGIGADILSGGAGNDSYTVENVGDVVDESNGASGDAGGIDIVTSSVSFALTGTAAFVENLALNGTAAVNATGNARNNVLTGNAAANTLNGDAGNDSLSGNAGDDTLIGGLGDDSLVGGDGADNLFGNDGNDRLDGGVGADALIGGAGNDSYTVDNVDDVVDETNGAGGDAGGIDIVTSSVSFALTGTAAFVENLALNGTSAVNATGNARNNVLTGNAAANTLNGDAGNDSLSGNAGDDTLIGGLGDDSLLGGDGVDNLFGNDGNDRLDGGTGADILSGGAGNDSYTVDNVGDVVDESNGAGDDAGGTDIVTSTVSFALIGTAGFVENLALNGTAAVNATGNARNNALIGNAAANTLNGDAGNDSLSGNAGDDTLIGGLGDDSLVGGDGVDNLFGNDGNDRLDGGIGGDVLSGGAGNDSYTVDNVGDIVDESNGAGGDAGGIDTVTSSLSFALTGTAAFVENLILNGTGAVNATGNARNNVLTGNAAANTLNGDAGNDSLSGNAGDDTLIGGLGDDSLLGGDGVDNLFGNDGNDRLDGGTGADIFSGGAGNDRFVFGVGSGHDTVLDFVGGPAFGDVIQLSATWGISSFAQLQSRMTQIGDDVLISFDANNSITLTSVAVNALAPNDFIFG